MSEKEHPRRSVRELALGVLMLVIGGVGVFWGWSVYRRDANIERNGQRAEGHLKKKSARLIYQSVSYDIEYWFTLPGGERVEASQKVEERLWDKLREGETFVVMYSAADPTQNFPLGGGQASIWTLVLAIMCAVFALVGGLIVTHFFRPELFD